MMTLESALNCQMVGHPEVIPFANLNACSSRTRLMKQTDSFIRHPTAALTPAVRDYSRAVSPRSNSPDPGV